MDDLIFITTPEVHLASNIFQNVPVILQYEDTPLIEVVHQQTAGFTAEFSIYHPDTTYLAKVKGSRIFLTEAGTKAGLKLEYPDKMTVCKLGSQTLFEMRRLDAAALKTEAELYTPDGSFLRCRDGSAVGVVSSAVDVLKGIGAPALEVGGSGGGKIVMKNSRIQAEIGILIEKNGAVSIAVNGRSKPAGKAQE